MNYALAVREQNLCFTIWLYLPCVSKTMPSTARVPIYPC